MGATDARINVHQCLDLGASGRSMWNKDLDAHSQLVVVKHLDEFQMARVAVLLQGDMLLEQNVVKQFHWPQQCKTL